MKLTVNGKEEVMEKEALTINDFLKIKEVKMPDMVTIELNGDILDREAFEHTSLKEGDVLELLYFMGGGRIGR